MDNLIVATAERIFADLADPKTVNAAKTPAWSQMLWAALTETGLPLAWVPEHLGGSDANLADGFGVIGAAGRFALAVPLVETMLACWLLSQAGIPSPEGAMTVAPATPRDIIKVNADGSLTGRARGIAFASDAAHLAVLAFGAAGSHVALVKTSSCRIETGQSLGYDASDIVTFQNVMPVATRPTPALDQTALMLMGATVRSLQMAGALETALRMSVTYANERVAFEKPIAKFQAVQHNLAQLAGEVAAALAAAGSAADTIATSPVFDDAVFLEAASAKIRCAEAAEKGAAIAHQIHGAIGFSMEHTLHRFTLRALGWRDDFGNETYWATELGRRVAKRGADELWPLVASR
jgi:acyl-CoA dehydrogenase